MHAGAGCIDMWSWRSNCVRGETRLKFVRSNKSTSSLPSGKRYPIKTPQKSHNIFNQIDFDIILTRQTQAVIHRIGIHDNRAPGRRTHMPSSKHISSDRSFQLNDSCANWTQKRNNYKWNSNPKIMNKSKLITTPLCHSLHYLRLGMIAIPITRTANARDQFINRFVCDRE